MRDDTTGPDGDAEAGGGASPFAQHDHARCLADALELVESECRARGLRLTPLRRRALEILLESHKAFGAYDVLARLSAEGLGSQPPVAYRALDFLVANGFAHKIERMNAFVACAHPGQRHEAAFLICRDCHVVMEHPVGGALSALAEEARASGFAVERATIEAEGLCHVCREA